MQRRLSAVTDGRSYGKVRVGQGNLNMTAQMGRRRRKGVRLASGEQQCTRLSSIALWTSGRKSVEQTLPTTNTIHTLLRGRNIATAVTPCHRHLRASTASGGLVLVQESLESLSALRPQQTLSQNAAAVFVGNAYNEKKGASVPADQEENIE